MIRSGASPLARDHQRRRRALARWIALPGLLALVIEPALWLVGTWRDPSYDSHGAWVALLVAGCLAASWASGPAAGGAAASRLAWGLLALTAVLRLAGRLLAVHTIGALALALDVGALALLLRTQRRPLALHPAALAGLFVLALPVEHLLQRLAGHPLQWAAAASAEWLLAPFFPTLAREGVLLVHPEVALAIDLPCSGARGGVLLSGLALLLLCRRRAGPGGLVAAAGAVAGGAWLANTARIVALFLGSWRGLPVALEPWHTLLGTASLASGALPLLALARRWPRRGPRNGRPPRRLQRPAPGAVLPWPAGVALSLLGIAVALAPERPVDVAAAGGALALPERLGAWRGEPLAPSPLERRYFARYGGSVDKRVYDDGQGAAHTALLVRTNAPLRHLHGPDRCLLGAGHRVTRLGVRPGAIPTVVYRSVAPDGRAWRVEASFLSDSGARAHDVSQALWHWLFQPDDTWSLIERITPWERCEQWPERCADFDGALFASFDAPAPRPLRPAAPAGPAPAGARLAARHAGPFPEPPERRHP